MTFLINRLYSLMSNIIIVLPTVLIALMGHELAHGWVSGKLGDPTPKMDGRMTLNPIKHLDPIGAILMIVTGFGWAKPVQVNPMYYKDRKKGMALVALAGPVANLVMALVGMILGMFFIKIFSGSMTVVKIIGNYTSTFVSMNLSFMVFNLIPLPPLDGSKILGMFLPSKAYYTMLQYERYSMIILMLLSLNGFFDSIIGTGVGIVWSAVWKIANVIVF